MFLSSLTLLTAAVTTTDDSVSWMDGAIPQVDISENGHLIDWLFGYTTIMNIFFFSLVCIGIFGFSFLYHHKRHPKPYYTYGNKKSQIIIATLIGVAVFLGVDLNIIRVSNNDYLNVFTNWPKNNEDIVRVQVMGQQWMWNFRLAGKDGLFNTEDDIVTNNDLRLPAGKKVVFQIISKDVIHSFYLPNARRKVDAIPGRLTRMWVHFKDMPGIYDIACAEMCGTYHYRMQAKLTLYSQEDYDDYLEQANVIMAQTVDPNNADNFWGWKWQ